MLQYAQKQKIRSAFHVSMDFYQRIYCDVLPAHKRQPSGVMCRYDLTTQKTDDSVNSCLCAGDYGQR